MENELVKRDELDVAVVDVEKMNKLCRALMETKHYQKLGEAGIFAIIMKARSLGVNPIEALNGGMYSIGDGKVEMGACLMAKMIRQKGHSITKARESDDTKCILHGKRADNGDTWCSSFSIADAKRAGLDKSPAWSRYPSAMCYNRALSLLARQLFPDVIGNSYVEGETTEDFIARPLRQEAIKETGEVVEASIEDEATEKFVDASKSTIEKDHAVLLDRIIGDDEVFRELLMDFILKKFGAKSLAEIPAEHVDMVITRAEARAKSMAAKKALEEESPVEGEVCV